MKIPLLPCSILVLSVASVEAALVASINPLNREIVSSPTAGSTISLTDFQALITATGDTTKAGVFDAETASGGMLATVESDYSIPDFTLTGATRYGRSDPGGVAAAAMTSGERFGYISTSELWSVAATAPGEVVTHFGATFSNRQAGALLVDVIATFSDSSTATFTSAAISDEYGFFGFQAPTGLGITSVGINESSVGNWLAYDDISFAVGVPVPEPSAFILSLAGVGMAFRRRRS